jgi:hypothetical protein
MKKQKKKRTRFKSRTHRQTSRPQVVEIAPADLAAYISRAEQAILPMIKQKRPDAGVALLLLELYTSMYLSFDSPASVGEVSVDLLTILALWQGGYYTPGEQYPFTLEETIHMVSQGDEEDDYSQYFLPFVPLPGDVPLGRNDLIHHFCASVVHHPRTHLWQIWIVVNGVYHIRGAFHDQRVAQRRLSEYIYWLRKCDEESLMRSDEVDHGDGIAEELPYPFLRYLFSHLDRYEIPL